MTTLITSNGRSLLLGRRYNPGHRLTPGEAMEMERLWAKRVQKNIDDWRPGAAETEAQFEARVRAYAEGYEFKEDSSSFRASPEQRLAWELSNASAEESALRYGWGRPQIEAEAERLRGLPSFRAQVQSELARRQELAAEAMRELLGEEP